MGFDHEVPKLFVHLQLYLEDIPLKQEAHFLRSIGSCLVQGSPECGSFQFDVFDSVFDAFNFVFDADQSTFDKSTLDQLIRFE